VRAKGEAPTRENEISKKVSVENEITPISLNEKLKNP